MVNNHSSCPGGGRGGRVGCWFGVDHMFSGVTVRRVHSSSKEYIKGGLYKIDCQLTANKGGRGGKGVRQTNITEPHGGSSKFIVTKPIFFDPLPPG